MSRHCLYRITNRWNSKSYVGAHSCGSRCKNGCTYFGSGIALRNAIKKYGRDAFSKEILAVFNTKDELYAAEAAMVNADFLKRHDVYNLTVGGGPPPITKSGDAGAVKSAASRVGRRRGPYRKRGRRDDAVERNLNALKPPMRLS